eukprot:5420617-Amphidinium_carterae.3
MKGVQKLFRKKSLRCDSRSASWVLVFVYLSPHCRHRQGVSYRISNKVRPSIILEDNHLFLSHGFTPTPASKKQQSDGAVLFIAMDS